MSFRGLRVEPGWTGVFTRDHAAGALPNGTRIYKAVGDEDDIHAIGASGMVLGSVATPPNMPAEWSHVRYFYFVEWDDALRVAIGVMDYKISAIPRGQNREKQ